MLLCPGVPKEVFRDAEMSRFTILSRFGTESSKLLDAANKNIEKYRYRIEIADVCRRNIDIVRSDFHKISIDPALDG